LIRYIATYLSLCYVQSIPLSSLDTISRGMMSNPWFPKLHAHTTHWVDRAVVAVLVYAPEALVVKSVSKADACPTSVPPHVHESIYFKNVSTDSSLCADRWISHTRRPLATSTSSSRRLRVLGGRTRAGATAGWSLVYCAISIDLTFILS
jgi:hypothetical protein